MPVKSYPKTPNKKDIFRIDDMQVPSICIVAPRGRTSSRTSLATPICSVEVRFTGMVAMDEHVARDVTAGLKMFLKKTLTPVIPHPAQ